MSGMKPLFVCTLVVLLTSGRSFVRAETPLESKPAAAEKSVLAESSKPASKPEATTAEFCRCVGEGATSRRIAAVLAAPLHKNGLDYVNQPLTDVVAQLSDEYGIPIQLNKAALEEAGVGVDAKISVSIHNISLRSAVRLMLKPVQLTYIIEDEVLTFTTKEDAEKDLKICVYDVRRLTGDKGDPSQLVDIICSCISTDTWDRNGKGMGVIRPFKPGLLVISQTHAVHEEIQKLLTMLDEMRNVHQDDANDAPAKAATDVSAERYTSPRPAGSESPKKAGASAKPARDDGPEYNPFGG